MSVEREKGNPRTKLRARRCKGIRKVTSEEGRKPVPLMQGRKYAKEEQATSLVKYC